MPFTEQNMPLLLEAAALDFKLKKNGAINPFYHNSYERGLFFIQKAVEIHGNTYGYSKVEYVNNNTKVILTCRTHKDFEQIPNNHIRGGGCPACSHTKVPTTEEWVAKAKRVHENRYDYTKSNYTGARKALEVTCPVHGVYQVRADHHLSGVGCIKCSGNYSPNTEEFIEKARNVHGDKYDYSKVIYKNNKEIIEIVCGLHGSFFQTPTNHLSFKGCPRCAGHNHDILYLLKCLETGWYKIGITTGNIKQRISGIGGNLEEIHHVLLECPREHESILHKKYEKDREYNLCVRNGNTEFFSITEEQVQEVIAYMNEVSSNA